MGSMRRGLATSLLLVVVPVACGLDWTVVSKADGATADLDGGADAAEQACRTNADCSSEHYCVFPDHRCGAGEPGRCATVPLATSCVPLEIQATCICTGHVLKSVCLGAAHGDDVSVDACEAPEPDMFRCGFRFCYRWELCVETVGAGGTDYACRPFDCKVPSCECPVAATACDAPTCRSVDGGIVARCDAPE